MTEHRMLPKLVIKISGANNFYLLISYHAKYHMYCYMHIMLSDLNKFGLIKTRYYIFFNVKVANKNLPSTGNETPLFLEGKRDRDSGFMY